MRCRFSENKNTSSEMHDGSFKWLTFDIITNQNGEIREEAEEHTWEIPNDEKSSKARI